MEQDAGVANLAFGDPPLPRARGDRAVVDVGALYRAHRVRLTRLATAITLDRSLAEEVVHDAFTGLHERAAVVSNPEAYLQRSVVNISIRVLRRRSVANRHRLDPPPITNAPELDEAWNAVVRLPPHQRAVVALRYWDDLSEADIARVLGVPAGTVKSRLHRAIRRLKEELKP